MELTGNYNSSFKTIQGEVSQNAFADFGIRKKIAEESWCWMPVYAMYSIRDFRKVWWTSPNTIPTARAEEGDLLPLAWVLGSEKAKPWPIREEEEGDRAQFLKTIYCDLVLI